MENLQTQGSVTSDLLLAEVLPAWSRQRIALADLGGADLPRGTVLKVDGGVYAPVEVADTTTAVAVLIESKTAVGADATAIAVLRGAVIAQDALLWPDGATDAQIADGAAALTALGIVVVEKL